MNRAATPPNAAPIRTIPNRESAAGSSFLLSFFENEVTIFAFQVTIVVVRRTEIGL